MWDNRTWFNIYVTRVPEGEEKREIEKNVWRKQLAQIWWKYKQIEEAQQAPTRINTKEKNSKTYHDHIAQNHV